MASRYLVVLIGSGWPSAAKRQQEQASRSMTAVDAEPGASRDVEDADGGTVSVAEAARLLARDRTRIYALLRSGDLVAATTGDDDLPGPLRIERSSVDRWLVAGGSRGGPLTMKNAWALIGLASGDQVFSERCLGLLERPEDLSRTRARLTRETLEKLAPRLRRRADLVVLQLPAPVREALERDATLVRTGVSAARAYGWHEPERGTRD